MSKKTILVVGDWFVDEHWVVAHERSITATRRGKSHYHVLQGRNSRVQGLCGAGIDASLLSAVGEKANEPFDVHGLGAWHPSDGLQLERMLKPESVEPLNQYSLAGPPRGRSARLHNLNELTGGLRGKLTTTRIFRVYFQDADGVDLVERFDWETPPNPKAASASGRRFWISQDIDGEKYGNRLKQLSPDAIVVRDHVKGVVSPALIRWLVKVHGSKPELKWYIYSKDWHLRQPRPRSEKWVLDSKSWLAQLRNQDVRLFFVPQVAAHNALYEPHRHVNNWRLPCHRPTWRAMKVMDALATAVGRAGSGPSVVVVPEPENKLVFARAPIEHTQNLLISWSDSSKPKPFEIGVPVGSMLFAALVALMIAEPKNDADKWLAQALAFTEAWADDESGRISDLVGWTPVKLQQLWMDPKEKPTAHCSTPRPWKKALKEWEEARDPTGFVSRTIETGPDTGRKEKRIEPWRAMTDVHGYICLAKHKRETIRAIKRQLAKFKASKEPSERRHVSMILEAEPGSGKTFLLDKLAREAEMLLLAFNITQMVSPSEILDCFDSIVSRQSSRELSKPILAFFDEIDAELAGERVYGKFLDPIDRGTYVRRGKTLFIRPCVWVFAGTKGKAGKDRVKHSDFTSRLTLPPLDFSTLEGNQAKLERRYVGAALLQRVFPDVKSVSGLVLESFELLCDKSPRECEKFVRNFRDIRQGEVRACNVPVECIESSWKSAGTAAKRRLPRKSMLEALRRWKNRAARQREGAMVKIIPQPDPLD